jgi:damage-control phosphatase, subfamily I
MKVHYECAACFLRQAREALDLATSDDQIKIEVTENITKILGERFRQGAVANEIGTKIHRTIKEETGNNDPYQKQRKKSNQIALKFLPKIEKLIQENPGLESYLKAAIAGNLIDFGALGLEFDMESRIISTMQKDLALNHSDRLEEELERADDVLYLADNIGEIVFDKLLIKKLKDYDVTVKVALKDKPILNDACISDALEIGLDDVAELISTGTDSIGVIYGDLSEEFKETLKNADLVIAKGLGNYEGLDEMDLRDKPVYCLLNAKCQPVSRDIGVKEGDNVVLRM